jgi:hypothetical protein
MAAFVARGSNPTLTRPPRLRSLREAELSGEGGFGGVPPDYDKTICQRGGGDERNKRFVVESL